MGGGRRVEDEVIYAAYRNVRRGGWGRRRLGAFLQREEGEVVNVVQTMGEEPTYTYISERKPRRAMAGPYPVYTRMLAQTAWIAIGRTRKKQAQLPWARPTWRTTTIYGIV